MFWFLRNVQDSGELEGFPFAGGFRHTSGHDLLKSSWWPDRTKRGVCPEPLAEKERARCLVGDGLEFAIC